MAFKRMGNIRKDYLARDILITLLGNSEVVQGISSSYVRYDREKDSDQGSEKPLTQLLVEVSLDLAERFCSSMYANSFETPTDSDSVDDLCQPSPIVLDGELGEL